MARICSCPEKAVGEVFELLVDPDGTTRSHLVSAGLYSSQERAEKAFKHLSHLSKYYFHRIKRRIVE